MIKDVVLALEIGSLRDAARDYAISVAATFEAHLAAIGFEYAPVVPPMDTVSALPSDILDAERQANRKAASDAIARFEEASRLAAVSAESRLVEASVSGATNVLGTIARSFDLSVVGQAEPKSMRDGLMIEGALFDSGRPVLVVPYIQRAGLKLDRVMVCWDGSRNAARAINDSMPFLSRAKTVDVVTISAGKDRSGEIKGADIVMGGYGHSRFREFVLGGATRGILASMTVPTLMSH
jgi:hypothetical protein